MTKSKLSRVLTKIEYSTLRNTFYTHLTLFCKSHQQKDVLSFILNRTLLFGKLAEKIPLRTFRDGSVSIGITGLGINKQNLYRTKKQLTELGLVFNQGETYTLNIHGMLKAILLILKKHAALRQHPSKGIDMQLERLNPILAKAREVCYRFKYPIKIHYGGAVMTLDQVQNHVIEKTHEHRKQRNVKRKGHALRPTWIRDYFVECCEEYRAGFSEGPWSNKDWGMAANFLKECVNEKLNPRTLISNACKHWSQFKYKILSEKGETVNLGHAVCFRKFYNFRREIMDFIKTNGNVVKISNYENSVYSVLDPNSDRKFTITKVDFDRLVNDETTEEELVKKYPPEKEMK